MAFDVDAELVRQRVQGSINRIRWNSGDIARIKARVGGRERDIRATSLQIPQVGKNLRFEVPAIVSASKVDGTSGTYTFTISSNAVDRSDDRINQHGWTLSAYRANPVVLWSHTSGLLPVGRTSKLWLEGNRLRATVQLALADANPSAAQVTALIDGGFLGAASVGFRPLKFNFSDDPARKFGIDFEQVELLEWSICCIPANTECLIDPSQGNKALATEQINARRSLEVDLIRSGRGSSLSTSASRAGERRARDLAIIRARSP